jgi:acetyl esterase/lipase
MTYCKDSPIRDVIYFWAILRRHSFHQGGIRVISWQAAMVKTGIRLYRTLRPKTQPIEKQRARMEMAVKWAPLPSGVVAEPVGAGGVPAEWITTPGIDRDRVILYLHGGAYYLGSINTHRPLVAPLTSAAGMRALLPDYRLAPEYPFPGALEDAARAYRWLLSEGIAPGNIVIAGDSAGGGLALATVVSLRDEGDPLPAGVVALSPWTDLAGTGGSLRSKAGADPMFGSVEMAPTARHYVGEHDPKTPLISPLYADMSGLPPLLIQVGEDEILLDDSTRLAERARAAGVDVTLDIWEGLFHVFQVFTFLPEARRAVKDIAAFMRERTGSAWQHL